MPDPIPRDEPTVVTDSRLADDSSHKVIADVHKSILRAYPSVTPLVIFTGRVKKKRQVGYYKFEHLEVDKYPRRLTIASDATAAATTLVVETNDYLKAAKNYHYVNERTRETVVLTENPSSDTFSNVARAIGGGGAPMQAGDQLLLLAPVHQEADTLGTIKSIKEERLYNYTEIIRTPMGWSRRTANTSYYGGSDPRAVRQRTALEHRISIELTGFFGKRHTRTTGDAKLQTFTGGLEYWIKSNVWNLNGQKLTERGLVEWLEDAMAMGDSGYMYGPGRKTLFCGRGFLTEIEFWARDKIRYTNLSKIVGMKVGEFRCSHGDLVIAPHPQFTGVHSNWAFLVDLRHVWYVYHKGGDTKLYENRHSRSYDGSQHEYLSDIGWMVDREFAHGLVKL